MGYGKYGGTVSLSTRVVQEELLLPGFGLQLKVGLGEMESLSIENLATITSPSSGVESGIESTTSALSEMVTHSVEARGVSVRL